MSPTTTLPPATVKPLALDELREELMRSLRTQNSCVITLHEREDIGPKKLENTYILLNIVNGWMHVVREDEGGSFRYESIAVSDVYGPTKPELDTRRWITLG